ncbi:unnamed protein product [Euphydryas editha]|uniref:Mos1 transposase HTH domain-containing protein n=1 Tax=Euphydryas editha TaxID=104508 RepID=A0AAU9V3W0_EUPED|nr:unnamed protein product [Euphydryas editha]
MEYPGGKNQHFRHLLFLIFHSGQNATEAARDICNVYGEVVISESTARATVCKVRMAILALKTRPTVGRLSEFDEKRLKTPLKEDGRQTI